MILWVQNWMMNKIKSREDEERFYDLREEEENQICAIVTTERYDWRKSIKQTEKTIYANWRAKRDID